MARESYQDFIEKFKPKKTTDDCYTPQKVYEAVKDWVIKTYDLQGAEILRPFYPGGDYQSETYTDNCVVIDNPPFSMLSSICRFYMTHGIRFFLFAPALTLFSVCAGECNYLPVSVDITYHNGAKINTSFVTNFGAYKIDTAPELFRAVEAAVDNVTEKLPKYVYPDNVVAVQTINSCASRGFDIKINQAHFIRALDEQREMKKTIFGAGFLISNREAEALRAAKEAKEEPIIWNLSPQEIEIVRKLEH